MTTIVLLGLIAFLQALISFLSLRKEIFKDFCLHFGLSLSAVIIIFVCIFDKDYLFFVETIISANAIIKIFSFLGITVLANAIIQMIIQVVRKKQE